LTMPVAHGVDAMSVTTPSGRSVPARVVRGTATFADTAEVGIYSLATARGTQLAAVNLMDADESNIAPRTLPAAPPAAEPSPVPVSREVWAWFVIAALVLLVIEMRLWWRRQTGGGLLGFGGRMRMPPDPGDRAALVLRGALLGLLVAVLMR